jgi:tetratricopeptide (TPR) repeat protein
LSFDAAAAARAVGAGNEAYAAGNYGAAIAAYEAALEAGADGADLWFNLGNAFYRAGEHGRAVLAFERVLRRDPGASDARDNLELVRSQTEAAQVQPREAFVGRVGSRVDPDAAAAALVVCWSLACTAWLLRRLARGHAARLACTIALAVLLAGTAAATATAAATWHVRAAGQAIVVEAGSVLRAPEPSAPQIFAAPEGIRLVSDRRIGDWAHVRLGEREGWIEARHLEPIDR